MAASSLEEDLVCPICLALFQEPHMLGCGHNFCLSCLRSAVPAGQEEGTCPECCEPFQLRELRRNRALGSLAMKVRRWRADDEEPLPPENPAGEPLGGLAKKIRLSEGEEETLPPGKPAEEPLGGLAKKIRLSEGEEEALPPGKPAGMWRCCEAHDKPLELFCTQDEAPVCVICQHLPQHRGHDFLPVPSAVQWAQGKLKAYLNPLEKFAKSKAKDEIDKQEEIAALQDDAEDLLCHLSKGFRALHGILDEKKTNIELMVESVKEVDLEDMEKSLISLKEDVSSCTETIAKIKVALEEADHVVFLKGFKELMDQVKEYHQRNKVDNEDENIEDEDESSSDEDISDADSGADSDNTEVIPMNVLLMTIEDFLDFEPWKEMCERIVPVKELEDKVFGP